MRCGDGPDPGKVMHSTLRLATIAADETARHANQEGRLCADLYAYRCTVCRKWHLTRQDRPGNILVHKAPPEELQRWAFPEMTPGRIMAEADDEQDARDRMFGE